MDRMSWDALVKARKAYLERQKNVEQIKAYLERQKNVEQIPLKEVYEHALNANWEGMKSWFDRNKFKVLSPVTVSGDTALHLAVYSKEEEPLKNLLAISQRIARGLRKDPFSIWNAYGNTILHEAVIAGNFEAVKLLVPNPPTDGRLEQIQRKNYAGETPLFTAASSGRRKILAYFLDELPAAEQITNNKLKEIHRQRDDKKSILHAAIEGQHFESALLLLYKDNTLRDLEDSEGLTCLHRLAAMPSAFKSGYNMGIFSRFIYSCSFSYTDSREGQSCIDKGKAVNLKLHNYKMPNYSIPEGCADSLSVKDGEGSQSCIDEVLKSIRPICRKIFRGWPMAKEIWKQKRKHESAKELVNLLVELNKIWRDQFIKPAVPSKTTVSAEPSLPNGQRKENHVKGQTSTEESLEEKKISPTLNPLFIAISNGTLEIAKATLEIHHPEAANDLGHNILQATIWTNNVDVQRKTQEEPPNPLFIAISNGVIETAESILKINPQAIELVNNQGQNILHVAVLHRQLEIFRLVKRNSILLARMSSKIDKNGYSLLHQVADMRHYRGGTKPSPALRLQEELKWFNRVEKIAPCCHVMHRDKINKMTAWELFLKQHQDQLKMASAWIEKTSQSCSAVAVLVATVVFAAPYTIPGGSNNHGLPILLHNRFFLAFTVLDVIALASSLTSVVMFLSLLITPFECENFYQNIPRKLLWGFTLLFFSVMTTMLAFGCTLFLIIRFRKQYWIAGLTSIAAFIPVSVFVVMQCSLYIECLKSLKEFYMQIIKFLPCYTSKSKCLPCFGSRRGDPGDKKWLKFDG